MENQTSTTSSALKWGLLLGVALVVYSIVIYLTGQVGNQSLGYVSYAFILGGVILALRDYKGINAGFMSFGQGLGVGSMASAIAGLISGAFTFIYMKFIDTTLVDKIREQAVAEYEKQGIPPEQAEAAAGMMDMMLSPGAMFVLAILGTLFIGFVFSLIVSAIMKNSKPEIEF